MNPNAPVDWQNATYTIKFIGTTTVTTPSVAPDATDAVTITAPSQIGRYNRVDCVFSGTALFTSTTGSALAQPVLVSEKHNLGAVQIYTNPTTLAAQQKWDMYVQFHAAPGLPVPNGYLSIRLGNIFTPTIPLSSNGDLLVHLDPIRSLNGVSQISIDYLGDPYYNMANVNFPLTNPPIPANVLGGGLGSGGGSGSGSSGGTAHATATAPGTPGATPTTTPGGDATPTASGPSAVLSSTTPTSGGNGALWLFVALIAVLVLGGGAGDALYLVRRAKSPIALGSQAPTNYSTQSPALPNDDTFPSMGGDR
jgi:hypothetical protein